MADDGFRPTRQWVLAGRAIFSVTNGREVYTYLIERADPKTDPITRREYPLTYFASLLTGPENSADYTYLGIVSGAESPAPWIRTTRASRHAQDSRPVSVLRWALGVIWSDGWDRLPSGYGIYSAGRCGCCGRLLTRPEGTSPEGYRYGFGPECWARIHSA